MVSLLLKRLNVDIYGLMVGLMMGLKFDIDGYALMRMNVIFMLRTVLGSLIEPDVVFCLPKYINNK
jgi:hypothetical protein